MKSAKGAAREGGCSPLQRGGDGARGAARRKTETSRPTCVLEIGRAWLRTLETAESGRITPPTDFFSGSTRDTRTLSMSGTSRFKPPDMLLDLELVAPFLDATLRSAIGSAILCWVTKARSRNQLRKIWIFENQIDATDQDDNGRARRRAAATAMKEYVCIY